MKPHPFEYVAPEGVDEAIALHADFETDSVLLAGGQSLMPLLNMRMALPDLVIDLGRIDGLAGCEIGADGTLRLGAMTRMRTIELAGDIARGFPVLAEAIEHVAHIGVRTRGTIGGTLCYAEPAAELPAVMTMLGAGFTVRGPGGERKIAAKDFYFGPMTTVLEEGEILTGIEVPPLSPGTGSAFLEVARTHGAFALVGVAALLHTDSEGRIDRTGLALCGVAGAPWTPDWMDQTAAGREPEADLFTEIGQRIGEEIEPMTDEHADGEYRSGVAATLVTRALSLANARREGGSRP